MSAPKITRIRPIAETDTAVLMELYKHLDTCNGDPTQVQEIIRQTQNFLNGDVTGPPRQMESLTYVGEFVDFKHPTNAKPVGTGRLIKLGDTEESDPLMYEETAKGIELTKKQRGGCIEFGGMVVGHKHRGTVVGKAITLMRAIIAKEFSGLFGANDIIIEFLPEYDDKDKKTNAFWTDLVLPGIKAKGKLERAKQMCSEFTETKIATDDDLVLALLKLSTEKRNMVVEECFPDVIDGNSITPQARQSMGTVGKETMGALINMQRIFVPGTLNVGGYFPVDGGPNYESQTGYGAVASRTVRVVYGEDNWVDNEIMSSPGRHNALVFNPVKGTAHGIKQMIGYAMPGIFTNSIAKLPYQAKELLGVPEGHHVTYHLLPQSQKTTLSK